MNDLSTVMFRSFLMILTTVITAFVIPYIKSKIGESRWQRLQEYAEYAVRCAEQLYTADEWEAKKRYVYSYVLQKSGELGMDLTEKDIDLLVEGIVNLVKKG